MPGVCFAFENEDVDVFSGTLDALDAWRYAMAVPGDIDRAWIVNLSNTPINPDALDRNFGWDISAEYPNLIGRVTHLVTATRGDHVSLWDFDHQTDWYVFGPAAGWGNETIPKGVYVPQSDPAKALHSTHVATTVMFHRYHVIGS